MDALGAKLFDIWDCFYWVVLEDLGPAVLGYLTDFVDNPYSPYNLIILILDKLDPTFLITFILNLLKM